MPTYPPNAIPRTGMAAPGVAHNDAPVLTDIVTHPLATRATIPAKEQLNGGAE